MDTAKRRSWSFELARECRYREERFEMAFERSSCASGGGESTEEEGRKTRVASRPKWSE